MKELFSDLITTLTSDGPDHPRVDQIIEKMRQAKAPPEAIADALATRSAWRRSRGEEPKPAAAAEEDSARLTSRPGFDKELGALNAYTDGKMKRYSLLFTVNGAAFAIAKLLAPRAGAEPPEPAVLGGLQLHHLAVGACVFTVLMCLDIWMYGRMMRKNYFAGAFGLAGKIVLCMMGAVLVAGWGLAAYR
jgi:hypothetical protein